MRSVMDRPADDRAIAPLRVPERVMPLEYCSACNADPAVSIHFNRLSRRSAGNAHVEQQRCAEAMPTGHEQQCTKGPSLRLN